MPLACPYCGSRHLRYAHRRNLSERLWSWVGVRPLRCRDCRKRFVGRTWRLSSTRYARCPNCWRMDLNIWSIQDHTPTAAQLALLRLGARPYRCEYCRINFVSFRRRLEKFSFSRWQRRKRQVEAADASEVSSGADSSPGVGEA